MNRKPECNICDCDAHAWAKATQHGTILVDRADQSWLERFAWHLICPRRQSPHAASGKAKNHGGQRLLHRAILNLKDGEIVDHINGNGLDCRRANFRPCVQKENARNRRSHRGSSSRFRGVSWCKRDKRWVAQIGVDYTRNHIGRFASEIEAAKAYDAEATKRFGQFARLNFQAARV